MRRPTGVDEVEREALSAEGLDPEDPAVVAAIDMVRWRGVDSGLRPQTASKLRVSPRGARR